MACAGRGSYDGTLRSSGSPSARRTNRSRSTPQIRLAPTPNIGTANTP